MFPKTSDIYFIIIRKNGAEIYKTMGNIYEHDSMSFKYVQNFMDMKISIENCYGFLFLFSLFLTLTN